MNDFQREKKLVIDYYDALDQAEGMQIAGVLEQYCSFNYLWRGFHPFNEQVSPGAVAKSFWLPFRHSLKRMQRRMDIFMSGRNEIDGFESTWVTSMGHLMGLFDEPWLGIPPTGKMAFLRYCEFHKIEGDKITETAMFFDIPHLMIQAGLQPFPSQTAAHLVQPGPIGHDGLMFEPQEIDEGEKTLAAINHMINELGNWDHELSLEEELALSWHDDMIWWGPTGIGATYTIERYAKQHSGPFRSSFSDRTFNGHICKFAEGGFGGFFGWPNLTLKLTDSFMGIPATNQVADMRVIDMYRREGDKLAENWIFIDLLHFWNQQGIDILSRATGAPND